MKRIGERVGVIFYKWKLYLTREVIITSMFLKEMEVWWWKKKSCSRLLQILIVIHLSLIHISRLFGSAFDCHHQWKSSAKMWGGICSVSYTHLIFSVTNDNCRKFKENQLMFCIQPWIVEFSRPIVFGEDRLRERGSLPVTFYVLTMVIFSMTNDNCHKFKQNQIIVYICARVVEDSNPIDFGEERLREMGSLPATFYVVTRDIFSWRTITAVNSNRIK